MPRTSRVCLLVLVLAACVPATTPPQLDYTPGAPVVVTDGRYDAGAFTVARPDGWRVITSAADAPTTVIFVSPDDDALIMLATEGIGEPPRPNTDEPLRDITQQIEQDGRTIAVYGAAPAAAWQAFQRTFAATVASVCVLPTRTRPLPAGQTCPSR